MLLFCYKRRLQMLPKGILFIITLKNKALWHTNCFALYTSLRA